VHPLDVKAGTPFLFAKYAGTEIRIGVGGAFSRAQDLVARPRC